MKDILATYTKEQLDFANKMVKSVYNNTNDVIEGAYRIHESMNDEQKMVLYYLVGCAFRYHKLIIPSEILKGKDNYYV